MIFNRVIGCHFQQTPLFQKLAANRLVLLNIVYHANFSYKFSKFFWISAFFRPKIQD